MRPLNYLTIVLLCVTLGVPISGAAKSLSGAYLAARQADVERHQLLRRAVQGRAGPLAGDDQHVHAELWDGARGQHQGL